MDTLYFAPSGVSHSEQSVDNNLSARLAAKISGFTHQCLSMQCVQCNNAHHCTAKPPLCLEEKG